MCIYNYCLLYVWCFVETDQRNEDKAILEAKLAKMEKAYREDHEKQQKETTLIQEENRKLEKKVDELKDQVERQSANLHSQIVAGQG